MIIRIFGYRVDFESAEDAAIRRQSYPSLSPEQFWPAADGSGDPLPGSFACGYCGKQVATPEHLATCAGKAQVEGDTCGYCGERLGGSPAKHYAGCAENPYHQRLVRP